MLEKRYDWIVNRIRPGTVVDFGSVQGEMHEYIKKNAKGVKIIDVDIANATVNHDLNKFPYPIESNFADTIVAGELLEHLQNPLGFLLECNRILKKGGKLLLTTPNAVGTYYLFPNWFTYGICTTHFYTWDMNLLLNLFKCTPLRVNQIMTMNNRHDGLLGLFLRIFKMYNPTIIVEALKV